MELACVLGRLLTTAPFLTHGYVSVLCVALLGAANTMLIPTIFSIAIHGV
ncbi:hypothetical protein [Gluconobacter potus]